MKKQPLYLSAASDHATLTLPPTEGKPTKIKVKVGEEVKDFPVAYLEKDVIECGNYVHPITKQRFDVDEKRLDHWAKNVNDMIAAGLEIPTPVDHAETQLARTQHDDPYVSADDNLGFVVGARRVGDRLRLTHQVIGDDAVAKAMRNRASVLVLPEYIDEKGRKWTDCIVHSAYTPMPVVSGMGEFLPIAASRTGSGETKAPVYTVAREANSGDPTMSNILDDKQLEQIRSELVANSGVSVADAAAMDEPALIEKMFEMCFGAGSDSANKDPNVQAAASDAKVQPMGLSRSKLAKIYIDLKNQLALSRAGGNGEIKLDDELAADRLSDVDDKIDGLVTAKKLKPTQATVVKAFLRNGEKPNKLMLARVNGGKMPAQLLVDALSENDPIAAPGQSGGKTGPQSGKLELSREADDKAKQDQAALKKKAEDFAKSRNKRK
jgi:hypothetical protein